MKEYAINIEKIDNDDCKCHSDAESNTSELENAEPLYDIFNNKYELVSLIDEGGSSKVFKARLR